MGTITWPNKEEISKKTLPELEALQRQELPIETRGYVILQIAHLYNHAGNSAENIPRLLNEVLLIGQQINDKSMLISAHGAYGWYYMKTYNNIRAFEHMQTARKLAVEHKDKNREQGITKVLAALFSKLGFNSKAVELQKEVYDWEIENNKLTVITCSSLGALLANNNQYEEALLYYKEAMEIGGDGFSKDEKLILLENLSISNMKLHRHQEAQAYAEQLEHCSNEYNNPFFLHRSYYLFATLRGIEEQWEESLRYGQLAYDFLGEKDWTDKLVDLTEVLMTAAAKLSKFELAYNFAEKLISFKTRLDDEELKRRASKFEYQLDMEKKEKQFEIRLTKTRLHTLTKIASDIAHEVQNPLQFVNNFSEFNMELGTELKDFLTANDPDEANATADEIIANSEKILTHGKRIADIVAQLIEQTRKADAGELEIDDKNLHDFS